MKTRTSLLCAGLCSGALLLTAHAQGTGTAGSAGASGAPATGGTSAAVTTSTSGTATSPTAPAPGTTATGVTVANPATPPSAAVTTSSTAITDVPVPPADPVLGTATTKPLGTLSGSTPAGNVTPSLNSSAIPSTPGVSRGTDPIGPQPIRELRESRVTDPLAPVTSNATTDNTRAMSPVVVSNPPPQPIVEEVPPSANANEVWVAGHYTYTGGNWTWVNGRWATPPSPGAAWIEGRYDPATRRWTEGQWQANGSAGAATRVTPGTTR